jgi:hypothetical protein
MAILIEDGGRVTDAYAMLLADGFELREDFARLRMPAEHILGKNEGAVSGHFERAAAGGCERNRRIGVRLPQRLGQRCSTGLVVTARAKRDVDVTD